MRKVNNKLGRYVFIAYCFILIHQAGGLFHPFSVLQIIALTFLYRVRRNDK
jgi:hypothetical protein